MGIRAIACDGVQPESLLKSIVPRLRAVARDRLEYLAELTDRKKRAQLGRRTAEGHEAAFSHDDNGIGDLFDIGERMGDADDRHSARHQAFEQLHDLAVGSFVESARDLVKEQEIRPAQYLGGETRAFSFAA